MLSRRAAALLSEPKMLPAGVLAVIDIEAMAAGGFYDKEGYWFEPTMDGSAGFYDCYAPDGKLHETGEWGRGGEWIKADGVYDEHARWHRPIVSPAAASGVGKKCAAPGMLEAAGGC